MREMRNMVQDLTCAQGRFELQAGVQVPFVMAA